MRFWQKHGVRIVVSLIPLVFALAHATGWMRLGYIQNLDNFIYDARLRLTMQQRLDDRIAIIDIDEISLAEQGRWPWSRNKMADLARMLLDEQEVSALGFDVVFAEPDHSSGLATLNELAANELHSMTSFQTQMTQLRETLNYDALFARVISNRNVVLAYYFTSDRQARTSGVLPAPVIKAQTLAGRNFQCTQWDGFGSNIPEIAQAASQAGFFNAIADEDGVVRSAPLLAQYQGQYYESLALAIFRRVKGLPELMPHFPSLSATASDAVRLQGGNMNQLIKVDDRAAILIPYRGYGGTRGGTFQYFSASDVLSSRLAPKHLKGKIVLVGSTAPALQDLRVTPVGQAYPGVETHANVLAALLDGQSIYKPDYAMGYEVTLLLLISLLLALVLPALSVPHAMMFGVAVLVGMVLLNTSLFLTYGLVLPLASLLLLPLTVYTLSMSSDHLFQSRAMQGLMKLFGRYVPPQLVERMVEHTGSYDMKAKNVEMTVMFCDLRGFTQMAEYMPPNVMQDMLNGVFNELTATILKHGGTIDKYMGDCVMAFWGAPVYSAQHAAQAVQAALDMTLAVQSINQAHQRKGLPDIKLGIGINTGVMCVGDMGSTMRRSYTVVGDAVNMAARLEALTKVYGLPILVGENTSQQASSFVWQEVDKVRVDGKSSATDIYTPLLQHSSQTALCTSSSSPDSKDNQQERDLWKQALQYYKLQEWDASLSCIRQLIDMNLENPLYPFYAKRIALLRSQSLSPSWDGSSDFGST